MCLDSMFAELKPSLSHLGLLEKLTKGDPEIQGPVWGMIQEALIEAQKLIDLPPGSTIELSKTYIDVTYGAGSYLEKNTLKKYKKAVTREFLTQNLYELVGLASSGEEFMNDAAGATLSYLYEIINFIRMECNFFFVDEKLLISQMNMAASIGNEMCTLIRYLGQVSMRAQPDAPYEPLLFDGIPEALILQRIALAFGVSFEKYEGLAWEPWHLTCYERAQLVS